MTIYALTKFLYNLPEKKVQQVLAMVSNKIVFDDFYCTLASLLLLPRPPHNPSIALESKMSGRLLLSSRL